MNKNALLEYFEECDFPRDKLSQDSLRFEDLLFVKDSNQPSIYANLENSFIKEKNESTPNPGTKTNTNTNVKPPVQSWRSNNNNFATDRQDAKANNTMSDPDRFNNGNKKEFRRDEGTGNNTIRNQYNPLTDSTVREEVSNVSGAGVNILGDLNDTMQEEQNNNKLGAMNINETMMGNSFNDYYKPPGNMPLTPTGTKMIPVAVPIPGFYPYPPMNPMMMNYKPPEPIKIENIFLFNKKFNFPQEQPSFYIFNPFLNMFTGPHSANTLYDMYSKKQLDSNFEIRLIDIFICKGNKVNEYSNIRIINNDDWTEDIIDSPLLQYTELFSKSFKLIEKNTNSQSERINNNKIQPNTNIVVEQKTVEKKITSNKPKYNDTIELGNTVIKEEYRDFLDTVNEETDSNKFDEGNKKPIQDKIEIVKEVEAQDESWEPASKKKKTNKKETPVDKSYYLVGNQAKEKKKEVKPTQKVEIVSPEELLKSLKPKVKEEEKPDFKAFGDINNNEYNSNNQGQGNKKGKKLSGKPQAANIKLGFKI